METAGKCLEWVKDHLALDEIGVYLEKREVTGSQEAVYTSLYDYLTETVARVPPGSGGVLFTPWLHGNRCPFEDPAAAGMFFNIRLNTGKKVVPHPLQALPGGLHLGEVVEPPPLGPHDGGNHGVHIHQLPVRHRGHPAGGAAVDVGGSHRRRPRADADEGRVGP